MKVTFNHPSDIDPKPVTAERSYDEAKTMATLYRRLGFRTSLDEERKTGSGAGRAAPRPNQRALAALLDNTSLSAEDRLKMAAELLQRMK